MTVWIRSIKGHLFGITIFVIYSVMFISKPVLGFNAIKNSVYYLKEMLAIIPVIFLLTALLDTWVPKEAIMKYLGDDSRIKGMVLSFVLGSISAGPIYAAFPICVMLHKKGASIKNIVIILSSWAVIKIPMLLNEVKFLGLKFMIVRWSLTVIAIIIFSWIASKIVHDDDIKQKKSDIKTGLFVNSKACIGCALCVKSYPEVFEINNKKVNIKDYEIFPNDKKLLFTIRNCPVKAIVYKN